MYPAPGYRKVKHNFLSDRLLLPPFSEVGLVDYPEETGSDIPHAHDDFQMIAFVTGTLRFSVNGENFSGTPGDVLLLPLSCATSGGSSKRAARCRSGSSRSSARSIWSSGRCWSQARV